MILSRRFWAFSMLFPLLSVLSSCNDENNPANPNGMTVSCAATPGSGTVPLPVGFGFKLEGAEGSTNVSVNYGDGVQGNDPYAGHVYRTAGSFTATFTATTATQTANCTAGVTAANPPSSGPNPGGNQPPNAAFKTDPAAGFGGRIDGRAPLEVNFNMCPTVDPERDPMLFTMDFQGDGPLEVSGETGGDCRRSFVYGPGAYRPRVCVTDLTGPAGTPRHSAQCQVYDVRVN